jgi:hypothetical protein
MASKYWIKLYHEILDDPKMGRLPDRLWRRVIEMFLLAGETDQDGQFPSVEDMAWRLRIPEDELRADLERIAQAGILSLEGAHYIVTRFAERQAPVSDAERMRRYRERKQDATYYGDAEDTTEQRDCNANVTNDVTIRNVDTDTDIDTEKNIGADAPAEPVALSENIPVAYNEWLELLRVAKNKSESVDILTRMACTLYPDRLTIDDQGIYARIGRMARDAGSTSKLANLLWDNARRALVDPLDYITAAIRNDKAGGNGHSRNEPPPRKQRTVRAEEL